MTVIERGDYTALPDSATLPIGHHKIRQQGTGAAASIANGALRLDAGSGGIRIERRGGYRPDNFQLFFRIKHVAAGLGTSYYPGFCFRSTKDDGANEPSYRQRLEWNGTVYAMTRKLGGGSSSVSSNISFASSIAATGSVLLGKVRIQGPLVRARCWKEGDAEPIGWPLSVADLYFTSPKGYLQFNMGGGGIVEISHWIVEDLPPAPILDPPQDGNIYVPADPSTLITSAVSNIPASGSSVQLPPPTVAPIVNIVMNGSPAIAPATPIAGQWQEVSLIQDATGGRVPTFTGVKWAGGTAPTFSTGANKIDQIGLRCFDGALWSGRVLGLDVR